MLTTAPVAPPEASTATEPSIASTPSSPSVEKQEAAPARFRRAVIVVKETYLETVMASGNQQLLADIAAKKPGLAEVQTAHDQHEECIKAVVTALEEAGIVMDTIHRNTEGLANHLQGVDLIVTVGGDGTFLRASHEVSSNIPLVGVNSAPDTSFGHYCVAVAEDFGAVLGRMCSGEFQPSRLLRLQLAIDGTPLAEPILNEVLVAHKHPAGTSRYQLTLADTEAQHKCSGLLIASPAGSTGFHRSEGGGVLPITARQYTFTERAPFLRIGETPVLKSAVVEAEQTLTVISQMQDGGIFIDGEHIEYDFPRGAVLTVTAGGNDLLAYVDPDCHSPFNADLTAGA